MNARNKVSDFTYKNEKSTFHIQFFHMFINFSTSLTSGQVLFLTQIQCSVS